MKQFLKWTGAAVLLASLPLAAQAPAPAPAADPQLPNASIDVSLQFASNYVFRGTDMHQNMFNQKRKSIDGKNEAWTFQPTITMKTPVDGLYVSIFGNFALEGREDKDVDQRLQTAPGAGDPTNTGCATVSNVLIDSVDTVGTSPCNSTGNASTYIRNTLTAATTYFPTGTYAGVSTVTVPKSHKEANGLKRADEIDITVGYTSATKVGVIGFGVVTYNYVNGRAKANPFGNVGGSYFGTEMFATYALPMFPDLTAKIYGDIVNSNQYYQLVYAKTIAINDSVAVSVSTGPGYSIERNLYSGGALASAFPAGANAAQTVSGWRDWTSSVGVTVKGFNVNFNAAYRPDLRFFDGDFATSRLVEADGGSTNHDGLVADPKLTNSGAVGDILQRSVTRSGQRLNSNYAFTARQKLPNWLYWVNLGYTITI